MTPVTEVLAGSSERSIEINEISDDEDEKNLRLALQMSLTEMQSGNLCFKDRGKRDSSEFLLDDLRIR